MLLLVAACALASAGCDQLDDPDDELRLGDFEAEVTGDVTAAFTGEAVYTTLQTDAGPVFALFFFRDRVIASGREAYAFTALSRAGTRPGVGVFTVRNDDAAANAFRGQYADITDAASPEAAGPVLAATDGVLTVTRLESDVLTGSFRFDGRGLHLPDRSAFIDATVSGTFEALPVAPSVITSLGIAFDLD